MGLFNFKKNKGLFLSEKDTVILEKYIEDNIGHFNNVFHEIVSPDLHIDVSIIEPTEEKDYYTLVTMGMSAFKMPIPSNMGKANRAEMAIRLPKNWNIKSNDEQDYWPIRIIKDLARFPYYDNCFFADGHYIDWPNNFANTNFNAVLLSRFVKGNNCKFNNNDEVIIYNVIPLYDSEFKFLVENGASKFFDIADDTVINSEININRNRII